MKDSFFVSRQGKNILKKLSDFINNNRLNSRNASFVVNVVYYPNGKKDNLIDIVKTPGLWHQNRYTCYTNFNQYTISSLASTIELNKKVFKCSSDIIIYQNRKQQHTKKRKNKQCANSKSLHLRMWVTSFFYGCCCAQFSTNRF